MKIFKSVVVALALVLITIGAVRAESVLYTFSISASDAVIGTYANMKLPDGSATINFPRTKGQKVYVQIDTENCTYSDPGVTVYIQSLYTNINTATGWASVSPYLLFTEAQNGTTGYIKSFTNEGTAFMRFQIKSGAASGSVTTYRLKVNYTD